MILQVMTCEALSAQRNRPLCALISKIENGHADVQLSTLFRIFSGLGKRISLTVL